MLQEKKQINNTAVIVSKSLMQFDPYPRNGINIDYKCTQKKKELSRDFIKLSRCETEKSILWAITAPMNRPIETTIPQQDSIVYYR